MDGSPKRARRCFSAQDKRRLLEAALEPGARMSDVARQFHVARSLLFRWRRTWDDAVVSGLAGEERTVAQATMRDLRVRLRRLQRLLAHKAEETEILRAALGLVARKTDVAAALAAGGRFPTKTIAHAIGVARSSLVERVKAAGTLPSAAPGVRHRSGIVERAPRPDDAELLADIRAILLDHPEYGYRRLTAALNSARAASGRPRVNAKRIYRVLKSDGLLLCAHSGRPSHVRLSYARAPVSADMKHVHDDANEQHAFSRIAGTVDTVDT